MDLKTTYKSIIESSNADDVVEYLSSNNNQSLMFYLKTLKACATSNKLLDYIDYINQPLRCDRGNIILIFIYLLIIIIITIIMNFY